MNIIPGTTDNVCIHTSPNIRAFVSTAAHKDDECTYTVAFVLFNIQRQ